MKFKNKFAHKSNYGSARPLSDIKYIVIHFTGNKGDTALNNCKYFQGSNRHASAHCFVDGSGVAYKSVSLKRVAWSVGGLYSLKNGAGSYYKKCTNSNSLSIEMCNCANGVPENVFEDAVALTRYYMKKYHVPASRVIRHWDVNGKDCPAPWVGKDNAGWKKFKKAIQGKSSKSSSKKVYGIVDTKISPLNMRKTASKKAAVFRKIQKGAKVEIVSKGTSWHKVKYNGKTGYCAAKYIKIL